MRNETKKRSISSAIMVAIAGSALVIATATPAAAVTESSPPDATPGVSIQTVFTPDELVQFHNEVVKADLPRSQGFVDGAVVTTYTLENGVKLTFSEPLVSPNTQVSPQLGAGWDGQGPYVLLNNVDQAAALGGGAAWALAFCILGPVACAAAGAIAVIVTTYVGAYGLCGGGRQLRINLSLLGYPECV